MGGEESFGAWLKGERKRRRLTQAALGQAVSYGADTIRKIEADERRFGDAQARLLAELWEVSADEIEAFVAWARGGSPSMRLSIPPATPATDSTTRSAVGLLPSPSAAVSPVVSLSASTSSLLPTSPRRVPRRTLILWLCCSGVIGVLLLGGALIAYRQGRESLGAKGTPGGVWVTPAQGFVAQGNTLRLAARAYPARPGDPPVATVNFTATWPGPGGEWQVACKVTTPEPGTADRYVCEWDMAMAGVPEGPVTVSFDVYDAKGNHTLAPNGLHAGTVRR